MRKFIAVGLVVAAGVSVAASRSRSAEPSPVELRPMRAPGGASIELEPPRGGVTVLVFYSAECPISNGYSPTLNRLAAEFPASKMKLVGLCVDPDLTDAEVKAHAKDFGLKFPIARDSGAVFGRKLGATVTPEGFVIDSAGKLRYHGRIDDQFAARQKRNAVKTTNELHDAVAALLEGRNPPTDFVEAVGCPIPEPRKNVAPPTYSREVARILQKNCQECHRAGQIGPFPLETFEQARKRANDIAAVVADHRMPPWKLDPSYGVKFKDDRSISEAEIHTLIAWAESGAHQGNPAEMPAPRKFTEGWMLGTPDLVLEMPEEFTVPASSDDIYRCFVIPAGISADQPVEAIEFKPGNPRIVHHIICYTETNGEARKRDAAEPGPGYACFSGAGVPASGFGGWAPGSMPARLPEGIGRVLPAKADVVMQVHYHASGKVETDRSRVGVYFARKPLKQILHWGIAANTKLSLPAGESHIEVKAEWRAPTDVVLHAAMPHMHLLGRDIAMSIEFPDGRVQELLRIPDWDFAWQYTYHLAVPIDLPKDSVVKVVAYYDNSAKNPHNPNHPPKVVTWGEATTDEMCIGFVGITKKGQDLTRPGEKDDLGEILDAPRNRGAQNGERRGAGK